jgi:ribosomal protein S18 acetylase RimI-like enzyme
MGEERVDTVRVEEVTSVDDELLDALNRLLPQLSSSAPALEEEEVGEMVDSPASILFVAREDDGDQVVGSLTLALFRIPTGLRAWIEDVVVDSEVRGRGVGSALVRAAIDRAGQMGCRTVDLTSRPSRQDANQLYLNLGFVRRETNVYRYSL